MLYILAFLLVVNSRLTSCTLITNKTERFSFKSGRDVRVSKLIKEDWPGPADIYLKR